MRKKTNEEYDAELKKLGIRARRLGDYQGAFVKILHRHCCGNEWLAMPANVLRDQDCSACRFKAKTKTNEKYDSDLKKANPTIVRAAEYGVSKRKMLHRHLDCGNTFMARPDHMLEGRSCPICVHKKKVAVFQGNHKKITSGYEALAIRLLLAAERLKPSEVHAFADGGVPTINFTYAGKRRVHSPDIFVPSKNLIVEVKSTATFGLITFKGSRTPGRHFQALKAKRRAAIKEGYRYRVMLMRPDGSEIKLPRNWHAMTHAEIKMSVQ